jgi:hypothetical protein
VGTEDIFKLTLGNKSLHEARYDKELSAVNID